MLTDAGTLRPALVWSKRLEEALQRPGVEPFGVIPLDLSLSDGQGWGACDKTHGHTARVPTLVLPGLGMVPSGSPSESEQGKNSRAIL
jgi:hypothetical protein